MTAVTTAVVERAGRRLRFSPSVCKAATSSSRHLFLTLSLVTGAGGKEVISGGRVGVEGVVGVVGVSPDFLLQ